jgi:hypothetical protein
MTPAGTPVGAITTQAKTGCATLSSASTNNQTAWAGNRRKAGTGKDVMECGMITHSSRCTASPDRLFQRHPQSVAVEASRL